MKRWIPIVCAIFLSSSVGMIAAQVPDTAAEQERQRRELLREKTQVLVERYLENAEAYEAALDYERAEAELLKARELDPTDSTVVDRLSTIQALLGREIGVPASAATTAAKRAEARRKQLRIAALQDLAGGREALNRGDYDRAVLLARNVVTTVKAQPNLDWGTVATDAQALLDDAERAQSLDRNEERSQRQKAAYADLQERERREMQLQEAKINALMSAATDAFLRNEFETAEELARAVLDEDPTNERAIELVDTAIDASRGRLREVALQQRRNRMREWRASMEEVRIPFADILTGPDAAEWARITELRGGRNEVDIGKIDPEELALRQRLRTTRMDADFDDMTMQQVANNIFFTTQIPVSVDPEVALELDDNGETVTLTGLRNLTVESILNILTEQVGDELAWTVRNGRVYITTLEKAGGEVLIRIHNIQDITFPLTDFKGVNIRDIPLPNEAGDDAETTIFNSELDRIRLVEPDEIETLIRENIARESWDLSDAYSLQFVDSNNLLVVHTPDVHQEIADFLNNMRAYSTSMVTLESRFIAITDAFIEEIGTDLRGLGPSGDSGTEFTLDDIDDPLATEGFDNSGTGSEPPSAGVLWDKGDSSYAASTNNFFGNPLGDLLSTVGGGSFQFTLLEDTQVNVVIRAVQKSLNATEITAPVVSVFNTQRAFVTVVNQISFIQGFEVDVANAARIADPIIGVLQEGIVLDVRPTISYDRKYITLDVQTTVADVEAFETFETNLGSDVGGSVEFSLPTLDIQDARTTVVVPDGGSVVLAGFKNITYRNRTAEVPWLSQIPVVGFFFREKGLADEMQDLIIIIRATITDFSDLQTTPVGG